MVSSKTLEFLLRGKREPHWEALLAEGLGLLGKGASDLTTDRKGAGWKVALARQLRERALVPNAWLAHSLCMGTANSLSSLISRHRQEALPDHGAWVILKNQENVD